MCCGWSPTAIWRSFVRCCARRRRASRSSRCCRTRRGRSACPKPTQCARFHSRHAIVPEALMGVLEVNFDGLPGPTHNYSGLSTGNLASERNRNLAANPRQAALQGLAKMKALADAGFAQAVLPPHERPAVAALRALGLGDNADSDAAVVARAGREAPQLLAACSSAAAMWAANAATVSPSSDTADGRVHFTPANLVSNFHRALETT